MIEIAAREARAARQRDRRKEGGLGHADPGVRRREGALGRGHVGTALEQIRRQSGRHRGRKGRHISGRRQHEGRRRFTDEHGERVLQRGAADAQTGGLGLGGRQFGFCAGDIDFGRSARLEAGGDEIQRPLTERGAVAHGGKLAIDGLAHHPYQFSNGKLKKYDATYRTMSRLTAFLDKAAKAKAVSAKLPVYLTEFGIQSVPDTLYGVTTAGQYEMRARAERTAYYNKRIKGFSQYLLTDDTAIGGFQSGLRYATGKAKPAFKAFQLTIDAKPTGGGKRPANSIWGIVRTATAPTPVTVQVYSGGKFKKLKTVTTNRLGAFTLKDKYRKGARYRIQVAAADGTTLTSPYTVPFSGYIAPGAYKR